MKRPRLWIGRNQYDGDYVVMYGSRTQIRAKGLDNYCRHDHSSEPICARGFEAACPHLKLKHGELIEVDVIRIGTAEPIKQNRSASVRAND